MSSNIENFFHIMGFNNQAKEWLGVDRTSKIIWFQPPFCGQGCQPLNQALDKIAKSCIQPDLEHVHGWGIYNLSGKPSLGPSFKIDPFGWHPFLVLC